jgi:iron-sulfur cluster repair protein YtfE (RIC family)
MNDLLPAPRPVECEPEWQSRPLCVLAMHISGVYHDHTRHELPLVARQTAELAAQFGDHRGPHLRGLTALLAELRDEVETHARTEDDLLFPILVAREHPAILTTAVTPDLLLRLVDSLAVEHVRIRRLLARITAHLYDTSLPAAEVPAWAELLRRVGRVRDHLLEELDLEDRCLLPRARESARADWGRRPYR